MPKCVLILGGDSFLGQSIQRLLTANGYEVHSTTRRKTFIQPGQAYLDFSDIPENWEPASPVDAALLCAASTKREVCENDPGGAYIVNVEAPEILARKLLRKGIYVVLLSTNLVLGGSKPFLETSAEYSPIDVYSSQKADAEKRLLALEGSRTGMAVLRLTKVLNPDGAMIQNWLNHGLQGRQVEVFKDVPIAPLAPEHVGGAVEALVEKRATGVFHLSGNKEISYADMARLVLHACGVPNELVMGIKGRDIDPIARLLPPHGSLGMGELQDQMDIQPPSPNEIAEIIATSLH